MKSRSTYRATRLIISALAASDLSARQLEEFADSLMGDHRTREDIAYLIRSLAQRFGEHEPKEDWSDSRGDVESEVLAIIKRRRLSKNVILSALRGISPAVHDRLANLPRMPVAEMIRQVREQGSDQLLVVLRDALLLGTPDQDEYLKQIMGR